MIGAKRAGSRPPAGGGSMGADTGRAMDSFHPYSVEELRAIRRLIVASGASVEEWAARLRRSADFLQPLSPGQAEIVAQQAMAIAADPEDYGDEIELLAAREELAAVPKGDRLRHVSRYVIAVRRRYFTGIPGEE
jgi:hypothetical protein